MGLNITNSLGFLWTQWKIQELIDARPNPNDSMSRIGAWLVYITAGERVWHRVEEAVDEVGPLAYHRDRRPCSRRNRCHPWHSAIPSHDLDSLAGLGKYLSIVTWKNRTDDHDVVGVGEIPNRRTRPSSAMLGED